MDTKFKPGDTVRLKSGGPVMTVGGYHKEHEKQVLCSWFQGTDVKLAPFIEDTLEKADTKTLPGWNGRLAV